MTTLLLGKGSFAAMAARAQHIQEVRQSNPPALVDKAARPTTTHNTSAQFTHSQQIIHVESGSPYYFYRYEEGKPVVYHDGYTPFAHDAAEVSENNHYLQLPGPFRSLTDRELKQKGFWKSLWSDHWGFCPYCGKGEEDQCSCSQPPAKVDNLLKFNDRVLVSENPEEGWTSAYLHSTNPDGGANVWTWGRTYEQVKCIGLEEHTSTFSHVIAYDKKLDPKAFVEDDDEEEEESDERDVEFRYDQKIMCSRTANCTETFDPAEPLSINNTSWFPSRFVAYSPEGEIIVWDRCYSAADADEDPDDADQVNFVSARVATTEELKHWTKLVSATRHQVGW